MSLIRKVGKIIRKKLAITQKSRIKTVAVTLVALMKLRGWINKSSMAKLQEVERGLQVSLYMLKLGSRIISISRVRR